MAQRTWLVTGATKGIGLAITQHLHARGDKVVGIARKAPNFEFPGRFVAANLRDAQETERIYHHILESETIDGVINNVGHGVRQPIPEMALTSFWDVMSINLVPALLSTKIFSPRMASRGFGRIVNIASTVVMGAPGNSAYSAAKAALVAFTRSWALELAAQGTTVNAVAPGNTKTDGFRRHCPEGSERESQLENRVPMKRLGDPSEVASAVGFFLSDEAKYITGQVLFVDGGMSLLR